MSESKPEREPEYKLRVPHHEARLSLGQPGSQHSISIPFEISNSFDLPIVGMQVSHFNFHRDLNFRHHQDVTSGQQIVDVDVKVEHGSHDHLNLRRGYLARHTFLWIPRFGYFIPTHMQQKGMHGRLGIFWETIKNKPPAD